MLLGIDELKLLCTGHHNEEMVYVPSMTEKNSLISKRKPLVSCQ